MSVRVMSLVWSIDLQASQKIVLLALADCANDEGMAWPSIATIARKASKSERTVQGMVAELEKAGHLTREQVPGRGCRYFIHPRKICTPAKSAPPQKLRKPPQNLHPTPAKSAPNPSLNHQEPSKQKQARELSDDWRPGTWPIGSKCRAVVDGWPPGELETQLEHFTAHHRAKGSKFKDWDAAWKTWVLGSRNFRKPDNVHRPQFTRPSTREIGESVAAELAAGRA